MVGPRRGKWRLGRGIHRIPGSWLWNVGGLGFVEMKDDKVFSIGTDEPDALVAALTRRG